MLARVDPSQTIAWTLIECMFRRCIGPWSWYCCCPRVSPLSFAFALPPKLAGSLLSAMIDPPLVISQSGVLAGSTQVFVATPLGSPCSCRLLSLLSANAVIVSEPGSGGPKKQKVASPLGPVVAVPLMLTEPLTWKRTTTFGTGFPDASCTVAVTQCSESTGFVAVGGFKVSVAG